MIKIYQTPTGAWRVQVDGVDYTFDTEVLARAFYDAEIRKAKIRPYIEALRTNATNVTNALIAFNGLKRDYVAGDLGEALTDADFNGSGITKAQFISYVASMAEIDTYASAAGRYNAIREVKRQG